MHLMVLVMCAGNWLQEHTDLRDQLNANFSLQELKKLTKEMQRRIEGCGRTEPQPKLSERALLRLEKEQQKRQRIEEQLREEGTEVSQEVSVWLVFCLHHSVCEFCEPALSAWGAQVVDRMMQLEAGQQTGKMPRPYPPVSPPAVSLLSYVERSWDYNAEPLFLC